MGNEPGEPPIDIERAEETTTEPPETGGPGDATHVATPSSADTLGPAAPGTSTIPPEIEPQFSAGETFAKRYRVVRTIGRGAMGTVYAARDLVVDEDVALKRLRLPAGESLERVRREVRLARRVTHRNTARTFDLGEFEGVHYITMELVDGQSLQIHLRRHGPMPVDQVLDVARQVCGGLQAAHDVGVIHRDLKPANILLESSGRAVITDFGVAFSLADAEFGEEAPFVGTPMYMAPEQVLGKPQDPRTDVYSLGLVIFEMLTGKTPFYEGSSVEIAMARLHAAPPDPRTHVDGIPDFFAEAVLQCLSPSMEQRPGGPTELGRLLDAVPSPTVAVPSSDLGEDPFAPTQPGERALAVMPFRYRGPADDHYLAEALTDELIDLLAMTRGLRVSSARATARFSRDQDPRAVGRLLGVDAIIDGSVQRAGDQVRIVARLVDVQTGFQRWSGRFEGPLQDVFSLQDRMAKRVAEALRLELSVLESRTAVPAEAVELYLRGRQRSREPGRVSLDEAVWLFDRALTSAPAFPLALAARADVAMLRWALTADGEERDWAGLARATVEAALKGAPDHAETHLAAARLEVTRGDFTAAARHMGIALRIAPTYAEAHAYLGLLQCDAGCSDEGLQHIELALELDPVDQQQAHFAVMRYHALHGNLAACEARLAWLRRSPNVPQFEVRLFEYRLSLWENDEERARRLDIAGAAPGTERIYEVLAHALRDALNRTFPDDVVADRLEQAVSGPSSPRRRTEWRQIAVEVLMWRGDRSQALQQLQRADEDGVLVDADWLESCPVLQGLQDDETFATIRERVRERADEIWKMGRMGLDAEGG